MKRILVFAAIIMTVMTSCIYTFYPLHSPDTLTDMPGLEGTFQLDDSDADNPELWTFTHKEKGTYELAITAGQQEGTLAVHVVKLGGEYFVDLLPSEYNSDLIPEFVAWNLMPVFTIAKLKPEGQNMHLLFFDPTWLEEKLSSHKIRIAHEVRRNMDNSGNLQSGDIEFILLTAQTEELQKFVEKYAHHTEAFDDDNITDLTRIQVR